MTRPLCRCAHGLGVVVVLLVEVALALVIAAMFAVALGCVRVPGRASDEPACVPANQDCEFPEGTP